MTRMNLTHTQENLISQNLVLQTECVKINVISEESNTMHHAINVRPEPKCGILKLSSYGYLRMIFERSTRL